jgi:ferredoxin
VSVVKTISEEALAGLVRDLVASGTRVLAPAQSSDGAVDYQAIQELGEAVLNGAMPRRSLRAALQPPTEPLFAWKRDARGLKIEPMRDPATPQVIVGARPCDAAGIEVLDKVMDWDYKDAPWFARREATTVISLACREPQPSCFCGSLGLGPSSGQGADLLLHRVDSDYLVEVLTPKGEALVAAHSARFQDTPGAEAPKPAGAADADGMLAGLAAAPQPWVKAVDEWLGTHFADELWQQISLRCLGCGGCTSVCPTCHCFDIVDEPEGTQRGLRRRNWDTCQASLFTLHASGHNPRNDQSARCRQRILHKFHIYPKRFGEVLCTGCGRCVRTCPAGVSLPEVLRDIAEKALAPEPVSGGSA